MNKLIAAVTVSIVALMASFSLVALAPVSSVNAATNGCEITIAGGKDCAKSDNQKSSLSVVIKDVTNVLLFVIGAVAVIVIIIGGIRYTISNGDSSQITAAKNTILYGVIGVVVALLAFAIVNFVVGAFGDNTAGNGSGGSGGAAN